MNCLQVWLLYQRMIEHADRITFVLLSQVEIMKATSRCGFTRGGTQSLERQALCTRADTGRRKRVRTGACVLTSSNPRTHLKSLLTSSDREPLSLWSSGSGAQLAFEHHLDLYEHENVYVPHTLGLHCNLQMYINIFFFTLGEMTGCFLSRPFLTLDTVSSEMMAF